MHLRICSKEVTSVETYVIQPKCGMRIEVREGQSIAVIDVDGGQVADFFAEVMGTHEEYLSPAVTIDCNESIHIGVGSVLYTNMYHAMFEIIHDDVGVHDLLFPSCSKAMYDFFYQNGAEHSNCLDNINAALGTHRKLIQPVNLFMNTQVSKNGKITIKPPVSKAGDKIVMRALVDCVLGVSACSVSECDTNSGNCSSIMVEVDG